MFDVAAAAAVVDRSLHRTGPPVATGPRAP
jgi:hypothetical protein